MKLVQQLNDADFSTLYRLEIAGKHVGYLRPQLAEILIRQAPDFLGQTGALTVSVIAENLTAKQLTEHFDTLHRQLAAHGLLPSGKDPWDHVKVEANEEAGLSYGAIRPSGDARVLAYARNVQAQLQGDQYKPAFPFETDGGTNWDEVFYWIATIPDNISPVPRDGEVKSFLRMTAVELIQSLRTEPQEWKTNSGVMFLQALALDPRYSNNFTSDERNALKALLTPDPRPPETRKERSLDLSSFPPRSKL